jgi:hypothetical protein
VVDEFSFQSVEHRAISSRRGHYEKDAVDMATLASDRRGNERAEDAGLLEARARFTS